MKRLCLSLLFVLALASVANAQVGGPGLPVGTIKDMGRKIFTGIGHMRITAQHEAGLEFNEYVIDECCWLDMTDGPRWISNGFELEEANFVEIVMPDGQPGYHFTGVYHWSARKIAFP